MPRLIAPVGQARDDFAIFLDLAERLGCAQRFDEGLNEEDWLRRLWDGSRAEGRRQGLVVPEFETFWEAGYWQVPPPDEPEVLLRDFRADPQGHPLKTPSGRIELFSSTIARFGYADCPPHPAWMGPREWLGSAGPGELHLVTNQPAGRLHSQLYQTQDDGLEPVLIHPDDADTRAIEDGVTTRLWNRRGACLARAVLSTDLRPGVLLMATGAWFAPQGSELERLEVNGNPNVLTDDHGTSQLGQACAALSVLVRIEPYRKD
jgi:biotin/methionine sulfoxide reductase